MLSLFEGDGITVGVGGGSAKLLLDGVTGKVNPELLFVNESREAEDVEVTKFASDLVRNTVADVICLSPSNIILLAPLPSDAKDGTFPVWA